MDTPLPHAELKLCKDCTWAHVTPMDFGLADQYRCHSPENILREPSPVTGELTITYYGPEFCESHRAGSATEISCGRIGQWFHAKTRSNKE